MNFRLEQSDDTPEINLVPLIDVLLVILIFLAATTTFTRTAQLDVTLPQASGHVEPAAAVQLTISRDGIYALNGRLLTGNTQDDIAQALRDALPYPASSAVIVHADAQASHQSVVRVLEAAAAAGIEKIAFATQGAR